MATKIQLRRDTAADWTSNNPTLAAGEFGWESDTNRFKIGDGATAWTSLAYASDGDTAGITFVGDDSTGTLVSQNETFKIAGGTGITTAVSGDTMTITASGGGGTITALNNQAENRLTTIGATTTELDGEANLTFDGTTLTLTGSAALDGVTIADNLITTNRSNDDLNIQANGTGRINAVSPLQDAQLWSALFGTETRVKGFRASHENLAVDADTLTDREYGHALHLGTKLTNGSSTNSNFRPRGTLIQSGVDLNGNSYTVASITRGPLAAQVSGVVSNSSGTAATLASVRGIESSAAVSDYNGSAGDITVTNAIGNQALNEFIRNGSGDITVTNSYGFHATSATGHEGTGTSTITNDYGFYVNSLAGTNKYAFYDATNSLSVFGDIQTQGVSITDNHITTNRSNDHLHISANGTGKVNISNSDAVPEDNLVYSNGFGSINRNRGVRIWESVSAQGDMTTADTRDYGHLLAKEWRLTSGLTSADSDNRYRAFQSVSAVDLNGATMTGTSSYSGPQGANGNTYLDNSNASAATMSHSTGFYSSVYVYPTVGAITATNTYGVRAEIDFDGSSASVSGTNGYLFHAAMYSDGGTTSLTNGYGVYISDLSLATNKYAFWDNTNSLSRFGAVILANQAGDPSTVTDSAHIYAKDVSASSEVFVRDEAGNVTQISPHNEAGEWQYWSENVKTGKKVRVNMERMIRRLEEITGEKFIENE